MSAQVLDKAQWLSARRLGSSDCATSCGENPWKSPQELWMERRGLTPAREFTTRATRRGKRLEAWSLEEYEIETGRKLLTDRAEIEAALTADGACEVVGWVETEDGRFQVVVRSTLYPWMTATLDGVSRGPLGDLAVVESKSLGWRQIVSWGNDDSGMAPATYRLQSLHTLIICSAIPEAHLTACIGADDYRLVIEKRAAPTFDLEAIVTLERYFMACVDSGECPTTETVAYESLKEARLKLHPGDSGTSVVLPADALPLHRIYQETRALRLDAEKREKRVKAQIEALIVPHQFGELSDGSGAYEWSTRSRAEYVCHASTWKQLDWRSAGKKHK